MGREEQLLSHLIRKNPAGTVEIEVDLIKPRPKQPRWKFNEKKIRELADSIKEHGVIEPIIVRPVAGGEYELIAGERRWRASKLLGNRRIPCIIKDENLSLLQIKVQSLVENVQREGLSSLETAMAIKDIMDEARKSGDKISMEEAGKMLGFSKVRVHQFLNILKLPDDILEKFCERDDLNEMHARALMSLKKSPQGQKELFSEILSRNLTGQQANEWAGRYLSSLPAESPTTKMVCIWKKNLTNLKGKMTKMDPAERDVVRKDMNNLIKEIQNLLKELK